jgi:cytochrome P450
VSEAENAAIPSRPQWDALLDELTRPAGRDDPYPRYAQLLREAPVVRAPDGAVVLTRYDDCHAALRDTALGHRDPDEVFGAFGFTDWREHPGVRLLQTSMLNLDPPEHTRLRRLVSRGFTARRVAALEGAVGQIVDELVEGLEGEGDFVERFAFPLPVHVIGELLGVPEEDRAMFQPLVRDWTMLLDTFTPETLDRANDAAAQIGDYLGALLAERRRTPRDDLLSAMAARDADGDHLGDDEARTMAALLFAAGFETTTHLLGNGLVALLAHPDEADRLRNDPSLAARATEELLRFDSPVQITGRDVLARTEVGGFTVEPGTRVVIYLGAANHDPAHFSDPGGLDLGRQEGAPMSFGGGVHFCLGAPLARLEARLAFPALLRRYPSLEVLGTGERRDSLTLRGFLSLPVRAA